MSGEFPDDTLVKPGTGMFKVSASERVVFMPAGATATMAAVRFLARKKGRGPYPARIYRLKRNGFPIDIVGGAMGAPVAAMALENLIAGGAKKIILAGVAGSLDPALKIGDLMVVNEAICDEGTSKDYFPEQNPPAASESLTAKLESELKRRGQAYSVGKAFTTDAFYRETRQKLARFRALGARVVEMELSAMFTIARFRKVEFASAVAISDEHSDTEWKSGFTSPSFFLNLLRVVDVSLDALTQ